MACALWGSTSPGSQRSHPHQRLRAMATHGSAHTCPQLPRMSQPAVSSPVLHSDWAGRDGGHRDLEPMRHALGPEQPGADGESPKDPGVCSCHMPWVSSDGGPVLRAGRQRPLHRGVHGVEG